MDRLEGAARRVFEVSVVPHEGGVSAGAEDPESVLSDQVLQGQGWGCRDVGGGIISWIIDGYELHECFLFLVRGDRNRPVGCGQAVIKR